MTIEEYFIMLHKLAEQKDRRDDAEDKRGPAHPS